VVVTEALNASSMTEHLQGYTAWPTSSHAHRPTAIALGIFDGVHLGHQTLMQTVRHHAQHEHLAAVVFTFSPHPAKILNPAYAPNLLEPMPARLAHLERHGMDAVVVQPFDKLFASQSAETFVTQILVGHLKVRHVIIGRDFVFGRKQQGNVALLQSLGEQHQFAVHACDPVRVDGMVVSSTRIRDFVHHGEMAGAQALLGRPYRLWGTTQRMAHQAAHTWAEVIPHAEQMPAVGLYAAWAVGAHGAAQALIEITAAQDDDDGTHRRCWVHLPYEASPSHQGDMAYYAFVARLRGANKHRGRLDGPPTPEEMAAAGTLWADQPEH
jgi:riboflavin kinase/FMN adenylyltransferase